MIKKLVWNKKESRTRRADGIAGLYTIWKQYGCNEYHLSLFGFAGSHKHTSLFTKYKSYRAAEKAADQHNQALILDWMIEDSRQIP